MWDEQAFSDWVLYSSDLRIKLAPLQVSGLRVFSLFSTFFSPNLSRRWRAEPLQYEGREGSRQDNVTVIWDKGRLLAHCPEAYVGANH